MADTHGTAAGSSASQARGTRPADYPTYDVGSRSSARWDDYEDYESNRSGSRVDDLVPVLGMLVGGGLGYMLATMIPRGRPQPAQRRTEGMGWSGASSSLERDESTDLIASSKVEGTAVYNRQGERLGDVYNFMVGKRSGKVAYAVMSFGGFLGIGQRYHALPWDVLTYDTERGGYVIDADKERLLGAPSFQQGEEPFSQTDDMRRIRDYWSSGRLSL